MKYLETYHARRSLKLYEIPPSLREMDTFIVIPAYRETLESIEAVLASIARQSTGHEGVAVLILVNYRESDKQLIKQEQDLLCEHLQSEVFRARWPFRLFVYGHIFGKRDYGVGLARKILMDTAFNYFYARGHNGIIINLDADTCVAHNYLDSIRTFFRNDPDKEAASIAFSHPVPARNRSSREEAALNYELHLRYFINMQRLIGLPYAFQTIGSAMAVKAFSYAKEGGMVKRQAGEDFYFLHKYSGKGTLGEINNTIVYPSCRPSDRVPFGTGKAVIALCEGSPPASYNPQSFYIIGKWIKQVFQNYEMSGLKDFPDSPLSGFLEQQQAVKAIENIFHHTSDYMAFKKRFFRWFDAFKLMKALHFLRDNNFPDKGIDECIRHFLGAIGIEFSGDPYENLLILRQHDANGKDLYSVPES